MIKNNDTKIKGIYLGNKRISKIYKGDEETYNDCFVVKGKFTDDSTEDDWYCFMGGGYQAANKRSLVDYTNPITKEFKYELLTKPDRVNYIFTGNPKVERIDVFKGTDKATLWNSVFEGCTGLDSIDLSEADTEKATTFSRMFWGAGFTSVKFGKQFGHNSTSFNDMFHQCPNIESLDLSMLDTRTATNFRAMFYGCGKLKSLDLRNFDTSKALDFYQMFSDCTNLEYLDISSFDTSAATTTKYMFPNNPALSTLKIGSRFTCENSKDFHAMFSGDSSLESLDISMIDTGKAELVSWMFAYTSKLRSLKLGEKFTCENATTFENMFYYATSLESLDLSMVNSKKANKVFSMFSFCHNLSSITFSKNFTCENTQDFRDMFRQCTNLEILDLSMLNTENGTNFRYMFNSCTKLRELKINLDLNLADGSGAEPNPTAWMFNGSTALTTVTGSIKNIKKYLDLSSCPLTSESAMLFINGLVEVEEPQTITFKASTYDSLTEEQIKIATDKGWSVVRV